MTSPQTGFGKIPSSFLEKNVYSKLGLKRPEVIVGPSTGVDTCVIQIGSNQVLVATTDPLSMIPELGPEDSAWMSVNLISNDLATSGLTPQYLMTDFNLPPYMSEEEFAKYWDSLSKECVRLGIAVVGGHTGKFEGCNYTIIGAGTAFCTGAKNRCIVSSGARVGDSVILTKGAAISATAILSRVFSERVTSKLGSGVQESASRYFKEISGTQDALLVASLGAGPSGITAMHDVTEGGVITALYEVAKASSVGMNISKRSIPVSEETRLICELFSIDPYISLGEGAFVVTCASSKVLQAIEMLRHKGTTAAVVGEVVERSNGVMVSDGDKKSEITAPQPDPYWLAYYTNSVSQSS